MIMMGIPNIYIKFPSDLDEFTILFRLMRMVDDPAAQNARWTIRRLQMLQSTPSASSLWQ